MGGNGRLSSSRDSRNKKEIDLITVLNKFQCTYLVMKGNEILSNLSYSVLISFPWYYLLNYVLRFCALV